MSLENTLSEEDMKSCLEASEFVRKINFTPSYDEKMKIASEYLSKDPNVTIWEDMCPISKLIQFCQVPIIKCDHIFERNLVLDSLGDGNYLEKNTNLVIRYDNYSNPVCIGYYENNKTIPLTPEKIELCRKMDMIPQDEYDRYVSEKERFRELLNNGQLKIIDRSREEIINDMKILKFDQEIIDKFLPDPVEEVD